MHRLLSALAAAAEPTRLRLLALAATGTFCVRDFETILGQSQPRLSRHLRLLAEAGLLERLREGPNCWFVIPRDRRGDLARRLLEDVPADDAQLAADRREAARVLAERARVASAQFQRSGADWDEMRALDLPAHWVEERLLALLPAAGGSLLDIGTGTGRLLELLGGRMRAGLGIDASRAMLALARVRLAQHGAALGHCSVRLGDLYRLDLPDACMDVVVLQMVLHHTLDPRAALAEAVRVLRPGGRLLVVDLALHEQAALADTLAHRWHGFSDDAIMTPLAQAGLTVAAPVIIPGSLEIRIWAAAVPATPARACADAPIYAAPNCDAPILNEVA